MVTCGGVQSPGVSLAHNWNEEEEEEVEDEWQGCYWTVSGGDYRESEHK